MNDTLKTIAERYTCRSYTGAPVSVDDLEIIATAGAQAPTAANSQRFRIIVVRNKSTVDEINDAALESFKNTEMYEHFKSMGGSMLYNASAMIIIAIEQGGQWSPELDCGIVVENMALAAQSLGIANCINAMAGPAFAGEAGEALKAKLQFPEGYVYGIALLLGYPTEVGQAHPAAMDKVLWV